MSNLTETTEATFPREVERSSCPVLVAFRAPGCAPCRTVAPTLESVALAYAGRARVVAVNADESHDLARRFAIRALPTVILFAAGKVQSRALGIRTQAEYERLLDEALAGTREHAAAS